MTVTWYCIDCTTQLDRSEIEDHETAGHTVRGHLRPDRLLPSHPKQLEIDLLTETSG